MVTIQKVVSREVFWHVFCLVTVRVLNSYHL